MIFQAKSGFFVIHFASFDIVGRTSTFKNFLSADHQCCDLETMVSRLECTRVHFVQVSVSVSRPEVLVSRQHAWCLRAYRRPALMAYALPVAFCTV